MIEFIMRVSTWEKSHVESFSWLMDIIMHFSYHLKGTSKRIAYIPAFCLSVCDLLAAYGGISDTRKN